MLLTSLLFKTILVAVLGFLGNHHADACSVPYIHEKSGNEAKVINVNSWKDVKLMCKIRFTGHIPKPGYYWLKDNQTLTLSVPQRMRLKPYRYLKIRRVKKEDAGFYTCVVVNDCGKNRYTMQLTVGDNAKPTELQKTESITDGFTVSPTTVSSERRSEAVVQTSMSWTDKIQYPAAVIALSVGVVILLIIAFGLCCWYVKKSQASSSTTMQSQGNIGSLRTTYVAQPNEYVIVPDRKRLYVD